MSLGTTSARAVQRLAWSLWALSVVLTVLALLLLVLNVSRPGGHVYDYWLENTLGALLFSTVGAIVGSRRPENAVGWLFCLVGFAYAVGQFSSQYAIYALLARPDSLPAG
jgi:glucose uptake protein GlcU